MSKIVSTATTLTGMVFVVLLGTAAPALADGDPQWNPGHGPDTGNPAPGTFNAGSLTQALTVGGIAFLVMVIAAAVVLGFVVLKRHQREPQ
jgi:ABC-type Fe3+ transport system permease subunit